MKKNGMIFLFGSCAYPTLEVLWRGYTHASMALAGGMAMVLINKVCCEKLKKKSLTVRCTAGSLIITSVEFVFGIIVNRMMHLGVWDYSNLPLNLFGQICVPFSAIWFFLTIPASAICRFCGALAERIGHMEQSVETSVTAP